MMIQVGTPETHGASSGIRRNSSEYNDGANIDSNGGNDDYPEGNMIRDAFSAGTGPADEDIGRVAFGNSLFLIEEEFILETGVLSEEELLDETLRETFPASDPPGHFSKSLVDYQTHSRNL